VVNNKVDRKMLGRKRYMAYDSSKFIAMVNLFRGAALTTDVQGE